MCVHLNFITVFDCVKVESILKQNEQILKHISTDNTKLHTTKTSEVEIKWGMRQGYPPLNIIQYYNEPRNTPRNVGNGYMTGKPLSKKMARYAYDAVIVSNNEDNFQRTVHAYALKTSAISKT